MPNRIIKESAFTSDKISMLSDFEFRLWVGLITQADDAGRGDARPAIIKGRVFALRDRTTLKDIDDALHTLAAHGCVSLYTVGGKPYYAFPNWAAHQRVRDVKPRYPGIEQADGFDNPPQFAADRGELPPNPIQSNPIESEIESESESESNSHAHAHEEELLSLVAVYEQGCGMIATTYFGEQLRHYAGILGYEVVKHGIEAAFLQGKTTPRYILAILKRYEHEKLTSMEAILRSEQRFENERKTNARSGARAQTVKKPEEYTGKDFFDDD